MKILLSTLVISTALGVNAQEVEREVVSSGGEYYSNGTGQLSFTMGEPVIETVGNGTNELTQGFHQTKISTIGLEDHDASFTATIFPNPAADFITIQIPELLDELNYTIVAADGKIITKGKVEQSKTIIPISEWANGIYMVRITRNTALAKTIKLQKF